MPRAGKARVPGTSLHPENGSRRWPEKLKARTAEDPVHGGTGSERPDRVLADRVLAKQ